MSLAFGMRRMELYFQFVVIAPQENGADEHPSARMRLIGASRSAPEA
jgi:hypothetical protein